MCSVGVTTQRRHSVSCGDIRRGRLLDAPAWSWRFSYIPFEYLGCLGEIFRSADMHPVVTHSFRSGFFGASQMEFGASRPQDGQTATCLPRQFFHLGFFRAWGGQFCTHFPSVTGFMPAQGVPCGLAELGVVYVPAPDHCPLGPVLTWVHTQHIHKPGHCHHLIPLILFCAHIGPTLSIFVHDYIPRRWAKWHSDCKCFSLSVANPFPGAPFSKTYLL